MRDWYEMRDRHEVGKLVLAAVLAALTLGARHRARRRSGLHKRPSGARRSVIPGLENSWIGQGYMLCNQMRSGVPARRSPRRSRKQIRLCTWRSFSTNSAQTHCTEVGVKPSSALHGSAPEKAPEGGSLLEVLQA